VVAILAVIATVILHAQGLGVARLSDGITSTEELSAVLFTKLLLPFEVTSVLILIAILGAVALASHCGSEEQGTGIRDQGSAVTLAGSDNRILQSPQGNAERTGEE
jgi:hypothetical protein